MPGKRRGAVINRDSWRVYCRRRLSNETTCTLAHHDLVVNTELYRHAQ